MKNKVSAWSTAAILGLGILTLSSPAEANRYCHSTCHTCYHVKYYCETVPPFWMYGYRYPAHKACWVKVNGEWVRSHYNWVPCTSRDKVYEIQK